MNNTNTNLYNLIKDFTYIDETQDEIYFMFTDASIDILKNFYEVSCEDLSREIVDCVMQNIDYMFTSLDSITYLIDKLEDQLICTNFISDAFPKVNITIVQLSPDLIEFICTKKRVDAR